MILVDTSVWIDHFRTGDAVLAGPLERNDVLAHAWVMGELALVGQLRQRREVISLLAGLPQAAVATPGEVLALIEHGKLSGIAIGYVGTRSSWPPPGSPRHRRSGPAIGACVPLPGGSGAHSLLAPRRIPRRRDRSTRLPDDRWTRLRARPSRAA